MARPGGDGKTVISSAGGGEGFPGKRLERVEGADVHCRMGDDVGGAEGFEAAEPHACAFILDSEPGDAGSRGELRRLDKGCRRGLRATAQEPPDRRHIDARHWCAVDDGGCKAPPPIRIVKKRHCIFHRVGQYRRHASGLVFLLIDQAVGGDPWHHGAQFGSDFLDIVVGLDTGVSP